VASGGACGDEWRCGERRGRAAWAPGLHDRRLELPQGVGACHHWPILTLSCRSNPFRNILMALAGAAFAGIFEPSFLSNGTFVRSFVQKHRWSLPPAARKRGGAMPRLPGCGCCRAMAGRLTHVRFAGERKYGCTGGIPKHTPYACSPQHPK
jgi:hypothetical protein